MTFHILTIFPDMFASYLGTGILKRALASGRLGVRIVNLRDFAEKSGVTDDCPYGGGPGMVMKVGPIKAALDDIKGGHADAFVILLTPQGVRLSQGLVENLAEKKDIVLICGRYEGVDERVAENFVNAEISIGDYILSGGELPALVVVDAVARLLPGVVGDEDSVREDTLSRGLLKYPQYTRPAVFEGMAVPEILLSGDHRRIARWRSQEALKRTLARRPELLESALLAPEELEELKQIRRKRKGS